MKLPAFVRNFIHKARQEAAREYHVSAAGDASARAGSEKTDSRGWIGMDLDGTLARSDIPWGTARIGEPVPQMMAFLRKLLVEGARVKIFTARASDPDQVAMVQAWLKVHGLPSLEVTNVKDFDMIRVYDDRAVQVLANQGIIVGMDSAAF